jgi:hypothetical protein
MRWAGRPHEHAVHFYGSDDELVAGVVEHLAAQPPAASVVIARPAIRDALAAQRRRAGIPTPVIDLDAGETLARFMVAGRPDRTRFRDVVGGAVAGVATGGGPVQAFGEMVALLWDDGNVEGAVELEELWNELGREHELTLRCAYPMASIDAADDLVAVAGVCATHSTVEGPAAIPQTDGKGDRQSRIFVPDLASVRSVRAFVVEALAAWGHEDRADDAQLVASELATNAIRHVQSPLRLVVSRDDDGITIAVDDVSTVAPAPRVATLDGYGGRGMPIVAALSKAHGVVVTAEGKSVWSTLARTA